jgi:hypothetical protein
MWRRMAVLQLLAIAGYYASLRLALHHHKRTLHPAQLIFLGSRVCDMKSSGSKMACVIPSL